MLAAMARLARHHGSCPPRILQSLINVAVQGSAQTSPSTSPPAAPLKAATLRPHAPEFVPSPAWATAASCVASCPPWSGPPLTRRLAARKAAGKPCTPLTFNTVSGKLEKSNMLLSSSASSSHLDASRPTSSLPATQCTSAGHTPRLFVPTSLHKWDTMDDDDKIEWVPLNPRSVLAADGLWALLLVDGPNLAHDWQNPAIPLTIRRPWRVFEEDIVDKLDESGWCDEVMVYVSEQCARIHAEGALAAFAGLSENQKRIYVDVSLVELSAYVCWMAAGD